MINNYEVGKYIYKQRKSLNLTQKELGEKLYLSPQAISKWETGETLPDTNILLLLADVLETSVDKILTGGKFVFQKRKEINISNILKGFKALEDLKLYFGSKSTFYLGAIEGINNKMNIDFEENIKDDYVKEVLIAEVIIQYLMDGYTVNKTELGIVIKSEKMRSTIEKYIK